MRDSIIKLARKITYVNKLPKANDPECRFLDALLDDELAEAALKLPRRKPQYIKDFAKKLGKSEQEAKRLAERLCDVGITEWTYDENGVEMIQLPLFAPGSMELALMKKEQAEEKPELSKTFFELAANLTELLAPYVPMGKGLIRVVPVEKAIEAESKKVKLEELTWWIDKYSPSLGVTTCQCRRAARINGQGTGDPEDEWCIVLGHFAESCIRTNRARRITKEEALDICYRAEERGYVHEVTNIDGPENSMFVCNCSWDTCLGLRTAWWCGTPNMSRSNFIASVDKDKCAACGRCMEVCPQNAVKLGQKICQKEPVEVKDAILPSDHIWTKKNWNMDLLTNRKNVIPETGTSPCKTACPAHVSVQAYLKLASQGKYVEALELIKKDNPLPAVCGSICNHRCETECTRKEVDEAVAIDEVKKFIAAKELDNATKYIPNKLYCDGKKIAVIGSGPAGLSCAYYLAVYGHEVTVFEKEEKLGGMLQFGIPSFRLEKDVVNAEIDVLKALGVEFKTGVEVGKDVTIKSLREHGYKGFYIAIGAQGGRKLGVEGDDANGVISGIEFLRNVNIGKDVKLPGKVVVIGGGNVAIDVARTASRLNPNEIAMYCLESRAEMPASEDEIEEAMEEKIVINNGWGVKRIVTTDGKVTGVEFMKCTAVFDTSGKFNPQYDVNETKVVDCDSVLATIGQSIEWGGFLEGTKLELNGNKTIKADKFTYVTSEDDIFAGGDVYSGPKFAIDAIAAGKEGAVSLNRAVREGHSLVLARDKREYVAIDKSNVAIPLEGFDLTPRQVPKKKKFSKLNFQDGRLCFTEEEIKAETSRCLECGAAHVDQNICIGCGLCTTRCKFDAITLSKKYDAWGTTYEGLIHGGLIPAAAKYTVKRGKDILIRTIKEDR